MLGSCAIIRRKSAPALRSPISARPSAHSAVGGGDVEAIAEAVAVELAEQRQRRRGREDLGADERRTVTDDQDVQGRGELRELGFGRRVARRRPTQIGRDRERVKGEVRERLQAGEIGVVDIARAYVVAASEADLPAPRIPGSVAHRIATDPSSRSGGSERSTDTGGCLARPASSSSIPMPGRSGAIR
jgi:hypothetical protein